MRIIAKRKEKCSKSNHCDLFVCNVQFARPVRTDICRQSRPISIKIRQMMLNVGFYIPSKSPVSATIVVNAFNWSKADTLVFFVCGSLMLNIFFKYFDLRENEKLNCQSQRKNTARRFELLLTTEQTGMKSIRSHSVTKIRRSIDAVANMYALHNTHYGNQTGIPNFVATRMSHASDCVCAVIYCVAMTAMMFVCFSLVCGAEWENSTSTFQFAWYSAHSNAFHPYWWVFCALVWHSAHWTKNCHCAADGLLLNCQKWTLVMERVR